MKKITKYVFIVTKFPDLAGGATYVENFGSALKDAGFEVEVIAMYRGPGSTKLPIHILYPNEQLYSRPVSFGISNKLQKIKILPKFLFKIINRRIHNFLTVRKLNSYDNHTAIIFTHVKTLIMLKEAGFTPALSSCLLIGQQHSPFSSLTHELWLQDALPKYYGELDIFTCLSDRDAEEFENLISIPSFGVPNPASISPVTITPPISERENKAVLLARFSPEKRIDLAIDLFLKARELVGSPKWTFEIYGDGPLKNELEKYISECADPSAIKLMGRTSAPFKELSNAKINLVTSLYEGFGMSVLEAAQVGTPSIAFAVSPGLNQLVEKTGGILISPVKDEKFYIDSLARFMNEESWQETLSYTVQNNSEYYDSANIIKIWEKIINN